MFAIRPKEKKLTPGEFKCCVEAEFDLAPSAPEPPSTTVDNGDGTSTTEWISASHPNDGGRMYLTLCCGDYLRLDFEDRDAPVGNNNWSVFITDTDIVPEDPQYAFPPDGDTADVHVDYPEFFPIVVCGLFLEMIWEGGVTFSITHGKATA